MLDEPALMRAIITEPESDAHRRAYAAWAMAHDDPRGEFIEVQLAFAQKQRAHTRISEWKQLAKRSSELLEAYRITWLRPLEDLFFDKLVARAEFIRGFVELVDMDARVFAGMADRIYSLAPILHLSLKNVMAYPEVLASPALSRIVSLEIGMQDLDDEALFILASSPAARRLRWLEIGSNRITQRGLDALCASPHLKQLAYVNCRGNEFVDPTDHFSYEGEEIVQTDPTEAGLALERKFGPIAWLHGPDAFDAAWPPLWDAVEPA